MSIERLHRAALAAGFAMAAPDDDPNLECVVARRIDMPASTNLPVVVNHASRLDLRSIEMLAPVFAFGARLRGRLPYIGGGAPA